MDSRENAVLAVALSVFCCAFLLGRAIGLDGPFFAFVMLLVIPILGSQLYLAATDADGSLPAGWIRAAMLVSVVLSGLYATLTTGFEQLAFQTASAVLLLGLLSDEFRSRDRKRKPVR
ncbi:hypothetical protein ACT4ML_14780 [Natrinema sp. LN54]|uniref:hypothetical protein n=1 Tax=Natrinema sp. LN54 TaxID=3458705 RepID=UPI004036D91E